MKLTGHKTVVVYRRYAIVSEADLSEVVKKLAALNGAKVLFFRFRVYQSRFTEFPAERVNRKWEMGRNSPADAEIGEWKMDRILSLVRSCLISILYFRML